MRVNRKRRSRSSLLKVWQALKMGRLAGPYPRKKAQDLRIVNLPSRYQYFLLRFIRKRSPEYVQDTVRAKFEERVADACLHYLSLKFGDTGGPRLTTKASYAISTLTLGARLEGIHKSAQGIAELLAQPLTNKRAIEDLAGCRRRLLIYLEPEGSTEYAYRTLTLEDLEDGSGDEVIINALMMDRATDLPQLFKHIRTLVECFEPAAAAIAATWIAGRVTAAVERHQRVHRLLTLKGNSGNRALEAWISDMLTIWETILGREIATSVASPGDKREGKAGGPLIRFLRDFGDILGIELSPDAWRRHVRDALALRRPASECRSMSDRPRPIDHIKTEAASRPEAEDALRRLAALMGAAFAREIAGKQLRMDDPSNLNLNDAQSSPEGQV
jgi:hypothetical protein